MDLGIFQGHFQCLAAEPGGGGEDHVRAVGHGLLQKLFHSLGGIAVEITAADDFIAEDLLHMGSAVLVALDPGADPGVELMDKGHVQLFKGVEQVEEIALAIHHGLHLHPCAAGHHIGPDGLEGFFQFGGSHAAQILIGVDLQPHQQGFLRQNVLGLAGGADGGKCIYKVVEIGVEGAALRILPDFAGFLAQEGQEGLVIAGAAELDGIEFGVFVELHKFVVSTDPGIVRERRDDADDIAGNTGGAEVIQHGDTLIALHHVELAQILKTLNGVLDTGVTQMGGAEVDPLDAELGIGTQQGLERGGKGRDTASGFGADDGVGGNFHHANVLMGVGRAFHQNIVQDDGVGMASGGGQFPVFLVAPAKRLGVFIFGDQKSAHKTASKSVILSYNIIAYF